MFIARRPFVVEHDEGVEGAEWGAEPLAAADRRDVLGGGVAEEGPGGHGRREGRRKEEGEEKQDLILGLRLAE